jgi:hypothetical protein
MAKIYIREQIKNAPRNELGVVQPDMPSLDQICGLSELEWLRAPNMGPKRLREECPARQ